MNANAVRLRLEPASLEVELARGDSIGVALARLGIELPCGGEGVCGACRVRVLSGSLPVTEADYSALTQAELDHGWRLACQARVETDLSLECGPAELEILADYTSLSGSSKQGLGIAIDLGTTTIAAQMIDLATGRVLAVQTGLNPQSSFGSDVMSRIKSVMEGADLTLPVRTALSKMIAKLTGERAEEVVEVILIGNTVMHHLFCGLDVEPLSRVPFESPHLQTQWFTPQELNWPLPATSTIRFERCLGGFVGSDILAGILATGIPASEQLVALVDLGTNGEIAIGNRRAIVCASTAAGPAFEAGAIRMGMRATTGAISHIAIEDGARRVTVVGEVPARGICGSGLVDAVALALNDGSILPSGRITGQPKELPVTDSVVLYQSDIRELQLAKGAICAGFRLLMRRFGMDTANLGAIYLAGAFGNYVQVDSAVAIGLLEAPRSLIRSAGNTALRGAKLMLLSTQEPEFPTIEHVNLAADPRFQEEFASSMRFPER